MQQPTSVCFIFHTYNEKKNKKKNHNFLKITLTQQHDLQIWPTTSGPGPVKSNLANLLGHWVRPSRSWYNAASSYQLPQKATKPLATHMRAGFILCRYRMDKARYFKLMLQQHGQWNLGNYVDSSLTAYIMHLTAQVPRVELYVCVYIYISLHWVTALVSYSSTTCVAVETSGHRRNLCGLSSP